MTSVTKAMIRMLADSTIAIGSDLVVDSQDVADCLRQALLAMSHEIDELAELPPVEAIPGGFLMAGTFHSRGQATSASVDPFVSQLEQDTPMEPRRSDSQEVVWKSWRSKCYPTAACKSMTPLSGATR